MKTRIKDLFPCAGMPSSLACRGVASARNRVLPALIAGLGLILAGRVTAQTFTVLHSFSTLSGTPSTNSDGADPQAALILSGNNLYGTANNGGSSHNGTVFRMNTDGLDFTILHSFTASFGPYPSTNSDGAFPDSTLVLSDNTLYGTTYEGGSSGIGTVFAVNTDGTNFTNVYNFTMTDAVTGTNSDGAFPVAGLILSGSTLYGTAQTGGSSGKGTVFAVNTNGTSFTNLHNFAGSDGANPSVRLTLSGNTLYGEADGGSSGSGTVFKVKVDGTGFTNLHNFTAAPNSTNSDGIQPYGGLILLGGILYGTAGYGGSSGNGTVFEVSTNGTGFSTLHTFTAKDPVTRTNSDGANPYGGLVLSGNTLYGTAAGGGTNGSGLLFAVNTDGAAFTNLYSFTSRDPGTGTNSDGAGPYGGLILSNTTLYGMAGSGGSSGNGTVFSLSVPTPPQLTLASDDNGGYFIRVQGTPNLTYRLQRAHSLTGPWITSAPQTAPASGLVEFHDLFPPSDRAFYRTVTQ